MQYTTYYNLPQYEGSDKTAWLTVFNQAMLAIDTGIHGAKATADSASSLATTANSAATQASNDVTTLTNSLNTVIGNINTINSLIGNGTPTTTDHTLIGAINELHADQGDLANLQTTDKSSLVAAINEAAQSGGSGSHTYSTTEQAVGYDTDGDIVYEKTYVGSNLSLSATEIIDAAFKDNTVKNVIQFDCIVKTGDGFSNGERYYASGTDYSFYGRIDNTGLTLIIINTTVTAYHITVRYTKA